MNGLVYDCIESLTKTVLAFTKSDPARGRSDCKKSLSKSDKGQLAPLRKQRLGRSQDNEQMPEVKQQQRNNQQQLANEGVGKEVKGTPTN